MLPVQLPTGGATVAPLGYSSTPGYDPDERFRRHLPSVRSFPLRPAYGLAASHLRAVDYQRASIAAYGP